jgi:probable O-glycosylation ligase (exosortase A-associated)
MNALSVRSEGIGAGTGVLFKQRVANKNFAVAKTAKPLVVIKLNSMPGEGSWAKSRGKHRLAFAGIYLFTLLMYSRPHEIMPGLFGWLPLPKIVAISSILIYIAAKIRAGEALIVWTLELKMLALLWALGLLFAPVSASPGDSFNVLFDPLIKILIVFAMQITLIDTRPRFRAMIGIMVFCQALYSLNSIRIFLTGGYSGTGTFQTRISGWGSSLGNPNDVACVLALMTPLSVICALSQRGWKRWLYFACAGVTAVAIMFTFSRAGFLALIASCGLIIWKATRGHRVKMLPLVAGLAVILIVAAPGDYMARLSTILNPRSDTTNSAQERQEHMLRAAELAIRRPIVGVGMGNFHIYAIHEMRAHNSYLEIAAELGIIGLIAFLVIVFAPLRSLRRIERETAAGGPRPDPGKHMVSVCLQASFVAFIIYGFFGSVQYDSYLYTLVAFAVALRRIHAAEIYSAAGAGCGAESPGSNVLVLQPRGSLWRSPGFWECRLKRKIAAGVLFKSVNREMAALRAGGAPGIRRRRQQPGTS